jgi:hypothetical protein
MYLRLHGPVSIRGTGPARRPPPRGGPPADGEQVEVRGGIGVGAIIGAAREAGREVNVGGRCASHSAKPATYEFLPTNAMPR